MQEDTYKISKKEKKMCSNTVREQNRNEAQPLLGNQNYAEEITRSRKKGIFVGFVLGLLIMAIVIVILNLPWDSVGKYKSVP